MGDRARNRAAQWPETRVWYSRLEEKLVSQTGHRLKEEGGWMKASPLGVLVCFVNVAKHV